MTIATQAKQRIAHVRATLGRKSLAMTAGAGALVVSGFASATTSDPSAATQAFSELQTQASDMASQAWPVVTAIVGSLLAIGLFKKFANKAT
ncbi:capsid protein [Modicisalibacter tunisiensis]|uniref:major coat protein n=1 Tax=Modicisalibacter tunisiensis TaxID=390637 RepID=UPI001CC99ADA|nr:major coat protein [Modicisalibacter tunisiensis]MBZ9538922.1 capsid protein [Modicisalibacter tunisiensis]